MVDMLQVLQKQVEAIGTRTQQQEYSIEDISQRLQGNTVGPVILKVGHKRAKVHCVLKGGPAIPPLSWSTRCGLRFGLWAFTSHAAVHEFPEDARCTRCFPSSSRLASPSSSSCSSSQSAAA